MHRGTKYVLAIFGTIFGLVLSASFFMSSYAQKVTETQKVETYNQDEQYREARREISKSVAASVFMDVVTQKDPTWVLDKAGYIERGEHNRSSYSSVMLKQDGKFVSVGILEHDSANDADSQFDALRSDGASVPLAGLGDRADKLLGGKTNFMAIRFRKGNFFVQIFSPDQKTAERFAGYVLKSLDSVAK